MFLGSKIFSVLTVVLSIFNQSIMSYFHTKRRNIYLQISFASTLMIQMLFARLIINHHVRRIFHIWGIQVQSIYLSIYTFIYIYVSIYLGKMPTKITSLSHPFYLNRIKLFFDRQDMTLGFIQHLILCTFSL